MVGCATLKPPYLNPGSGNAWAGQRRANWLKVCVLYDEVSDLELNLGLAPPMGSDKE